MNSLIIKAHNISNRPGYIATLNGVELPLVTSVKVNTAVGELTTVDITVVVERTTDSEVVIHPLEDFYGREERTKDMVDFEQRISESNRRSREEFINNLKSKP